MRITTADYLLLLPIGVLLLSLLGVFAMYILPPVVVSHLFFGGSLALSVMWARYGIRRSIFSTRGERV